MVKSVELTTRKYARNSLRAYLEGKKNPNWAVGVVKSSGVRGQALVEIFDYLKGYSETVRYKEVFSACRKLGWL
jgi:hypothetical protein